MTDAAHNQHSGHRRPSYRDRTGRSRSSPPVQKCCAEMMSVSFARSQSMGPIPECRQALNDAGKNTSRWHQYLDECPPDRGRNPRCFNGLPYHCGLPQIKIVCQQIWGHSVRVLLDPAAAFSNATPPTIRTALTISRPQNCERNESVGTLSRWELTAVRQAIETAWISASVRRTFIELLVPAGVKFLAWAGGVDVDGQGGQCLGHARDPSLSNLKND